MTHHHLSYLEQISEVLEEEHKGLAARFGFIGKWISLKNLVKIQGCDPPKLRRCKACQALITVHDIVIKDKKIIINCSLCGLKRIQSIRG